MVYASQESYMAGWNVITLIEILPGTVLVVYTHIHIGVSIYSVRAQLELQPVYQML